MAEKLTYEELEQRVKELEREAAKRKRVEKAVRESEEKFNAIAGSAKDAIIIMDNEGNISYWNKAAEKIFGYSAHEALGKELHVFLAPRKYHDAYRRGLPAFKTTGHGPVVGKTLELEAVRRDGTRFPIELSLSAVKIEEKWNALGILRDISRRKEAEEALERVHNELEQRVEERTTDLRIANEKLQAEITERERAGEALRESVRRVQVAYDQAIIYAEQLKEEISERRRAEEEKEKLQAQLQQAQKMEAIGTLAGGIAHDFNNLLMGIQGHASLMMLHTGSDDPAFERLKGIQEMVQTGANLTKQLLGFARGGKYEVKTIRAVAQIQYSEQSCSELRLSYEKINGAN